MKILAIADIHGDSNLSKNLAKKAKKENVDLIVVAGDLTWFGQPAKGIISPFVEAGKPVFAVHGNHESESMIKELERTYKNVTNLHEKNVVKDDVGFFGTGTTDWGFKEDEEQVYKELSSAHRGIKNLNKKIMISHCPPEGSKIELIGFPGSRGVRKAIDKFKPNVVICGHMHPGGGLTEKINNSIVMNVARKYKIFEI